MPSSLVFRALACCLLLLTSPTARADDSSVVNDKEGGFTAVFPGKVTRTTQEIGSGDAKATLHMLAYQTSSKEVAFLAAWRETDATDSPKAAERKLSLAQSATRARFGRDTKLVGQTDLMFNGRLGREFSFSGTAAGKPVFVHARIYLTDTRMYQLYVVRMGSEPVDFVDAVKFFGAFKLLK